MATRLDPLEYLERSDKWFLGGGRGVMFAPVFPRFLEAFGFWDEACFVDVRLERLFTTLVLDERERPLALRREGRRWTPDALTQTFITGDGLRLREDKVLTPNDVLASRLTIHNDGRRTRSLSLILWSLQNRTLFHPGKTAAGAEETAKAGDYLTFAHSVVYGEAPYADRPAENAGWGERAPVRRMEEPHRLFVALGADRAPISYAVHLAERADTAPLWQTSIVPEKFRDGRLSNEFMPDGAPPPPDPPLAKGGVGGSGAPQEVSGHLHLCLHYDLEIPPGESRAIQFGAAVNLDRNLALLHVQNDLQQDVAMMSRENWQACFAGVPYFECNDPHLQKYYWYRWYGLRLLTVNIEGHKIEGEEGVRFAYPCVLEGIDGFRSHISYSAQCHMLEAGWMHNPALAQGCMEGMFAAQEHTGYLPGHLYLWRETRGFYHADWGANALQLYHLTGDRSFIERAYPGLSRYADYFERDRDREDSHLYDIMDQGETGQEYMSRYLFVDESADDWRRIQLKGVDATVYIYRLQRALGEMAGMLGKDEEAAVWTRKADATRDAVRERMWDPERRFFFDVDPKTGARSPYKAAVGFYPFLCDIATPEHLPAITEHLLNPNEFWTAFPVPASSLDDPYFSADAEWKGRRMSCPWNGRVWPMTNSHVCEALTRAALTLDPALKPYAVDLISRFVRMMFYDGDPERPNGFEHYNPFTGTPSMYRGIDDYQHSWVVDLLVKYLVGIQPNGSDTLLLDPLPFSVNRFVMEGIRYRGHMVDVRWDRTEGYVVCIDGAVRARAPERTRLEVPLG
jgi:hypothetical protein